MEEQTLYRKVFIHGEEDLPSKEARYFVGHKMGGQLADWFIPEHEIGNKYWLDNYDWYLLPVPLPSDKETELREALVAMVYQFAYRGTLNGIENIHTGGLSALEEAFEVLGLNDPQPVDVIIK